MHACDGVADRHCMPGVSMVSAADCGKCVLPGLPFGLPVLDSQDVYKRQVITLVYIEGDLDSDDLITILFTKKDL